MSILPRLNVSNVEDPEAQRNFQLIQTFLNNFDSVIAGMQFVELIFPQANGTLKYPLNNYKLAHTLGLVPVDVIVTHLSGGVAPQTTPPTAPSTVTFNYGLFDANNLDISVSGPCRVRFLYGNSAKASGVNSAPTDAQTFSGGV